MSTLVIVSPMMALTVQIPPIVGPKKVGFARLVKRGPNLVDRAVKSVTFARTLLQTNCSRDAQGGMTDPGNSPPVSIATKSARAKYGDHYRR